MSGGALTSPGLTLQDVSVHYGAAPVVHGVSCSFAPGGLIGLIGPNGAGKTSVLKACAGIMPATGQITIQGQPLGALAPAERARRIGYLPQTRTVAWPVSAARLVGLGRLPHLSPWQDPTDADAEAVTTALRKTDTAHLAERAVTTLSGGELARVLVARLLAGAPDIVLADEPIAGLDPAHSLQVMDLLRGLARSGRTVIVVLHDLNIAGRFCDRLVLLDQGRIVADGLPAQVFTPEILARHYQVTAAILPFQGETVVVPWSA